MSSCAICGGVGISLKYHRWNTREPADLRTSFPGLANNEKGYHICDDCSCSRFAGKGRTKPCTLPRTPGAGPVSVLAICLADADILPCPTLTFLLLQRCDKHR